MFAELKLKLPSLSPTTYSSALTQATRTTKKDLKIKQLALTILFYALAPLAKTVDFVFRYKEMSLLERVSSSCKSFAHKTQKAASKKWNKLKKDPKQFLKAHTIEVVTKYPKTTTAIGAIALVSTIAMAKRSPSSPTPNTSASTPSTSAPAPSTPAPKVEQKIPSQKPSNTSASKTTSQTIEQNTQTEAQKPQQIAPKIVFKLVREPSKNINATKISYEPKIVDNGTCPAKAQPDAQPTIGIQGKIMTLVNVATLVSSVIGLGLGLGLNCQLNRHSIG